MSAYGQKWSFTCAVFQIKKPRSNDRGFIREIRTALFTQVPGSQCHPVCVLQNLNCIYSAGVTSATLGIVFIIPNIGAYDSGFIIHCSLGVYQLGSIMAKKGL